MTKNRSKIGLVIVVSNISNELLFFPIIRFYRIYKPSMFHLNFFSSEKYIQIQQIPKKQKNLNKIYIFIK